jgi:hypothetical protein
MPGNKFSSFLYATTQTVKVSIPFIVTLYFETTCCITLVTADTHQYLRSRILFLCSIVCLMNNHLKILHFVAFDNEDLK